MAIEDMFVRVQRHPDGVLQRYTVDLWLASGRRERTTLTLDSETVPDASDPQTLVATGLRLFHQLFSGPLALMFQQTWAAINARNDQLRLRLALDPAAPALHALPWELMHFDDSSGLEPPRPLAVDPRILFSRYVESAELDEGRPLARRPIRMLMVLASPIDLARWHLAELNREAEQRDFETRFSAAIAAGQLRCDVLPLASPEALRTALLRGTLDAEASAAETGYDVLLYYGHGLFHPELGTRLVLEDPQTRRALLYDSNTLVSLLRTLPVSHRLSLVLMVACNSAVAGALHSLATRLLIESGVPAVLAMQRLIEVVLARSFTHHLSDALLRDGTIDVAVNSARRRIFNPEATGWSTPVLYMRYATGRIFLPNAQLEYVAAILRDPEFARWCGEAYIDVAVMQVAAGQDWHLLRVRPEDAPAAMGAIETLDQTLGLHLQPERRRPEPRRPQKTNLVALIGPPHSGQTTVLRRLAYQLAEAVTQDVTRPPGIFISLVGYDQQRGQQRLERQIVEQASAITPALGEFLGTTMRQTHTAREPEGPPRFVLLLDDLDTLPERARSEAARELMRLAQRLPNERFIVTSAQDSYPGPHLSRASVLVIQPLGERQILGYLQQRDASTAALLYRQIRDKRLLNLASDPSLLTLLIEQLTSATPDGFTRNQLVQSYLDRMLGTLDRRFSLGAAARTSLIALAWQSCWEHREHLSLATIFRTLAQVRHQRDYSLEELYDLLRAARLLTGVGSSAARFVNSHLQAYCAAVALASRADRQERLADIIAMCANQELMLWWEEVIYALVGMLNDLTPLFRLLASAIRAGSDGHALMAARCLEALAPRQEARLDPALRSELLDACVLRLRSTREPSAERREQLVVALGRLQYPQVRHELHRLVIERVRPSTSGPRYEYTNVRIAAARALRTIYLAALPDEAEAPSDAAGNPAAPRSAGLPTVAGTLTNALPGAGVSPPTLRELRDDQTLLRFMAIWRRGSAGRTELHTLLHTSPSAPERALAAFALGDMIDTRLKRMLDARHLLRVILSPDDTAEQVISEDWQDTMWAAADALTLFHPPDVIRLLRVLIRYNPTVADSAAQQLAYLAGRLRATDSEVVDWLIRLLVTNPGQVIKAKALQSLAWIGVGIAERHVPLVDGSQGPTLKQLIQALAAAESVPPLALGNFTVAPHRPDRADHDLYLRRKAIEALAWIGDATTIRDLGQRVPNWPLELREHWYQTVATIQQRQYVILGSGSRL